MCVKPRLQYLDHIEPPFEPLKPQYLDHVEPLFESPFTPPATPTATTLDPSKFAKLHIRASGIPPQGTADQTTKDAKHSKSMPHVPVKNDFNDTIPDASHHEALLSTDVTIESASSSDDSLESGYSSEEETEALRTGHSACNINQYSLHLLVENGVRSLLSYFCHPTSNESPGEVTGAGNYRSYTYGHTTNAVKVTVPTNSSNETTGHQDRQSGGKRSSAGDGDEDHEDDTKPRKRANKGQDAPDALGSSERRFACFFFKQNPFKYKHRKSCRGPGFSSVSRAKEHAYRHHFLHDCDRCFENHSNENELSVHRRLVPPCDVQPYQNPDRHPVEGVNTRLRTLLQSPRGPRRSDPTEQWQEAYRIIFPREDSVPSCFYESYDFTHGQDPVIRDHNRMELVEQLRRGLHPSLDTRIQQYLQSVIASELEAVILLLGSDPHTSHVQTVLNRFFSMSWPRRSSQVADDAVLQETLGGSTPLILQSTPENTSGEMVTYGDFSSCQPRLQPVMPPFGFPPSESIEQYNNVIPMTSDWDLTSTEPTVSYSSDNFPTAIQFPLVAGSSNIFPSVHSQASIEGSHTKRSTGAKRKGPITEEAEQSAQSAHAAARMAESLDDQLPLLNDVDGNNMPLLQEPDLTMFGMGEMGFSQYLGDGSTGQDWWYD